MPSENATIVDRIYEAFETRNFLTFFNLLSPTIHITQCPEVPWGGVFDGLEEAKVFFGKVNTYLEDHVAIERVIDGSDRIAVIGRGHGTIKSTGRGFDVPIMHLWDSRMDSPSDWRLFSTFQPCRPHSRRNTRFAPLLASSA
jgi:uncharacterized protein